MPLRQKINTMNLKNYKPLLPLLALAGLAYVVHRVAFYLLDINDATFYYSIETLYMLFLVLSIMVFVVLLKVKERSFDNVGMSFLLSTSIKMISLLSDFKAYIAGYSSKQCNREKEFFYDVYSLFSN